VTLTDEEVREALAEVVAAIVESVRVALERTPPELSADIMDKGIIITGGGSLLRNLDRRLREETGLPISYAEDPLASVVLGTGAMLTDMDLLRKISLTYRAGAPGLTVDWAIGRGRTIMEPDRRKRPPNALRLTHNALRPTVRVSP